MSAPADDILAGDSPADFIAKRKAARAAELRAELNSAVATMLDAIAELDAGELSRGRSLALASHCSEVDRAVGHYRNAQTLGTNPDIINELLAKRGTP